MENQKKKIMTKSLYLPLATTLASTDTLRNSSGAGHVPNSVGCKIQEFLLLDHFSVESRATDSLILWSIELHLGLAKLGVSGHGSELSREN